MNPTIIYRVHSPEPTPTCIYFERYESRVPKQPPCEIFIATNKRNDTLTTDRRLIHRELKQIKDDIRDIKQEQHRQQQEILPTYYTVRQGYPPEASFISAPLTSHDQHPLQDSIYYCNDYGNIVEQRTYVERSTYRPKTGSTTYQDSYKKRSPSPKPIGYMCYPVYTDRSLTLKELQKRIPSLSPAVHRCVPQTLTSFDNKYPTRR